MASGERKPYSHAGHELTYDVDYRRRHPVQSLTRFLNPDLIRQARLFATMTDSLRIQVPAPLAAHCWVGGISDRTLIVVTDSASVAVPVYYQQHEILKRINNDFRTDLPAPLTKLKTKISRAHPAAVDKAAQRPRLSADNALNLASSAASITDPELKTAMMRLARRGRAKNER